MARFDDFSTMVVLLLACCSMLVATGLADEEIAPFSGIEPSYDIAFAPGLSYDEPQDRYVMPPEPEIGFFEYLDNCTAKLTDKCGEMIVLALMNNTEFSYNCCQRLVLMGKRCHEDLVKTAASFPENKAIGSKICQKGLEIWNHCVTLAGEDVSPAPAPSS